MVEEGDLIAKRTRSQLPLQDVPIESIEGTEHLKPCQKLGGCCCFFLFFKND